MTDKRSWMLGISKYYDLNEAFLQNCAENGIDSVEFSYTENKTNYDKVEQWSKNTGVKIWSRHLDFIHLSIAHPDKERITRTLETFRRFIHEAAMTGAKTVVVHPSSEPIEDQDRETRMSESIESFGKLVDFAKPYGITVCCESLPRTCLCHNSEEALKIINSVDGLKLCFDTNHLLTEDPVHFIQKTGKHIHTLHVSDYDFVDEKHWLPLEGKVDWKSLIAELEKADYKGPFNYECGSPEVIRENRDKLYSL